MEQGAVVLSLRQLTKRFGSVTAVDGIDLDIQRGEFITLLGPSGCGKTTTVRMIGGYEEPSGGRIIVDGVDVTHLPARKREIGMVFQDYALFPHMTVADNIAYPLRMRGWARDRIRARVKEMLELVRLEGMDGRHPYELSGGQRQRIALARALAFSPRLLLMDEALGALDAKLREYMRIEIRRIQRLLGITTIHVTHDQEEALSMSDRVVVMRQARIAQVATPRELYAAPSSTYVADFVGRINLLPGRVVEHGADGTRVALDWGAGPGLAGPTVLARHTPAFAPDAPVRLGIRPEALSLAPSPGAAAAGLRGTVASSRFSGPVEYITVLLAGDRPVEVLRRPGEGVPEEAVAVTWAPADALVLEPGE